MGAYIIRRLIQVIIILILVTIIIFGAMQLLPGGPLLLYINQFGIDQLNQQDLERFIIEYGLDRPVIVQYFDWLTDILSGDLGTSIVHHRSVGSLLAQALPISLYLGFLTVVISSFLGVTMGTIAAVRRGTWLDTVVTVIANIGMTIPIFWLGVLTIYIFGLQLDWFPISGYESPLEDFWESTRHVVLPVACLSVIPIASVARQTRSSILEVVRQDYIRTAMSKGLLERVVIIKHVMKNALIPIVTLIGIQVPMIFGGQVLIETVFNIPGLGRLTVNAVLGQDMSVVMACCLIISIMAVFSNLIVDISYGWLDPRIRYD